MDWDPIARPDFRPHFNLDTATIQAYFGILQAVITKFGAIPEEYQPVFTAFRMAITNDTPAEALQMAKINFAQALDVLGISHSILAAPASLPEAFTAQGFTEMQLVVPGLYIGSYHPASDKATLDQAGITHICCCIGVPPRFSEDFKYMTLPAADSPDQDMSQYFDTTYQFISEALASNGKVLVHCGAGISRAATITLAFMLRSMHISLESAFSHLRAVRPVVSPNTGFVRQLRKLETELGLK
eukprot:m.205769 g.205769  ORF g.205769 m.205769 type:complete len:243 (-) comp16899_c2_seq6:2452-3180(-)